MTIPRAFQTLQGSRKRVLILHWTANDQARLERLRASKYFAAPEAGQELQDAELVRERAKREESEDRVMSGRETALQDGQELIERQAASREADREAQRLSEDLVCNPMQVDWDP
mmetsp:Transcript_47213/g.85031  ORF Transcript_47213/g.85031 Transcript_47213/m.85031 type:complete len:114 (-) Transcript_47213:175-516(-)|eukprot:CAMPEP_0197646870 /NCGR_PEP_ID=MMETSP1338-20131121/23903_1 /TAXON_ID=43686 ORGANISM="Pelagodinium beii, Strain RCC1491" /NCGR_SAMPLE_ID=MMETSP1338 /ASSEMBLY_ACC=CAM_ASM_000754 /LENGTH=113 /DNA_ID=CAMNT_0043220551 /DNA_START=37 /DNA_END=378 /DNA_ORIENTATION=-